MAAVLRIRQHQGVGAKAASNPPADLLKSYVDRLVKLVPAEVVGLYLAGKAMIQAVHPAVSRAAGGAPITGQGYWIGWTLFCLVAVIFVRAWATSDRKTGTPAEWPAVAIATASFGIWIYSTGDAFALYEGLWHPLLASLLVLGWTFLAPLIYRAPFPATPPTPIPPTNAANMQARSGGPSASGVDAPSPHPTGPVGLKVFTKGDAEQAVGFDVSNGAAKTPQGSATFAFSSTDAVSTSVDNQLSTDGHPYPHDPNGVMQDDYTYVPATMQGFLLAVAARLSDERFHFDPGSIAPSSAVQKTLRQLKFAIWEKTR